MGALHVMLAHLERIVVLQEEERRLQAQKVLSAALAENEALRASQKLLKLEEREAEMAMQGTLAQFVVH